MGVAVSLSPSSAKIRQMVVRGAYQGQGHGRRVIHDLEEYLAQRGFGHLVMHARMTAVGFYSKLGYTGVGIPHVRMEKRLQPCSTGFC